MLKQGTRVLITGGAGFIGSHVARAVAQAGGRVRVLDDLSTGKRERLLGVPHLDFIEADVRSDAAVQRAMQGAHAVVHLAAAPAGQDALRTHVNLSGALSVLNAAKAIEKRERPRVVLCSSGGVYGPQTGFVLHEEVTPKPATPDAVIALATEHFGRVYRDAYGVQVTTLRLFRTFGPEEDAERKDCSVVARFIRAALDGHSPVILGDGQQTRDLVYVENVVHALLAATECNEPDIFNVASGEAVQINFLWTMICELAGKRRRAIDPTYVPAPSWDPRHARPQIARACKALRWAPSVRLRDGLSRTVHFYQAERKQDPNAWFSPPEEEQHKRPQRTRRPPTPPPRRLADNVIEVNEEDLMVDDEPKEKELDIEWAPVPTIRGLGR